MILTLKGSKNMITFSYTEDCGKLTLRIKRARATRERTPEFFKHSLQEINSMEETPTNIIAVTIYYKIQI